MPMATMSDHARERCAEMGISTKVAKAIVRNPAVTRPGNPGTGAVVVTSDRHPEYAVVLDTETDVVVTVLFRTHVEYDRCGSTFIPKGGE